MSSRHNDENRPFTRPTNKDGSAGQAKETEEEKEQGQDGGSVAATPGTQDRRSNVAKAPVSAPRSDSDLPTAHFRSPLGGYPDFLEFFNDPHPSSPRMSTTISPLATRQPNTPQSRAPDALRLQIPETPASSGRKRQATSEAIRSPTGPGHPSQVRRVEPTNTVVTPHVATTPLSNPAGAARTGSARTSIEWTNPWDAAGRGSSRRPIISNNPRATDPARPSTSSKQPALRPSSAPFEASQSSAGPSSTAEASARRSSDQTTDEHTPSADTADESEDRGAMPESPTTGRRHNDSDETYILSSNSSRSSTPDRSHIGTYIEARRRATARNPREASIVEADAPGEAGLVSDDSSPGQSEREAEPNATPSMNPSGSGTDPSTAAAPVTAQTAESTPGSNDTPSSSSSIVEVGLESGGNMGTLAQLLLQDRTQHATATAPAGTIDPNTFRQSASTDSSGFVHIEPTWRQATAPSSTTTGSTHEAIRTVMGPPSIDQSRTGHPVFGPRHPPETPPPPASRARAGSVLSRSVGYGGSTLTPESPMTRRAVRDLEAFVGEDIPRNQVPNAFGNIERYPGVWRPPPPPIERRVVSTPTANVTQIGVPREASGSEAQVGGRRVVSNPADSVQHNGIGAVRFDRSGHCQHHRNSQSLSTAAHAALRMNDTPYPQTPRRPRAGTGVQRFRYTPSVLEPADPDWSGSRSLRAAMSGTNLADTDPDRDPVPGYGQAPPSAGEARMAMMVMEPARRPPPRGQPATPTRLPPDGTPLTTSASGTLTSTRGPGGRMINTVLLGGPTPDIEVEITRQVSAVNGGPARVLPFEDPSTTFTIGPAPQVLIRSGPPLQPAPALNDGNSGQPAEPHQSQPRPENQTRNRLLPAPSYALVDAPHPPHQATQASQANEPPIQPPPSYGARDSIPPDPQVATGGGVAGTNGPVNVAQTAASEVAGVATSEPSQAVPIDRGRNLSALPARAADPRGIEIGLRQSMAPVVRPDSHLPADRTVALPLDSRPSHSASPYVPEASNPFTQLAPAAGLPGVATESPQVPASVDGADDQLPADGLIEYLRPSESSPPHPGTDRWASPVPAMPGPDVAMSANRTPAIPNGPDTLPSDPTPSHSRPSAHLPVEAPDPSRRPAATADPRQEVSAARDHQAIPTGPRSVSQIAARHNASLAASFNANQNADIQMRDRAVHHPNEATTVSGENPEAPAPPRQNRVRAAAPARAGGAEAQTGIEHPATGSAGVDALDRTRSAPVVPPDRLPGVASIMPRTSFAAVQSNVGFTTTQVINSHAHPRGPVHPAERSAIHRDPHWPVNHHPAGHESTRQAGSDMGSFHPMPPATQNNNFHTDALSRAAIPGMMNFGHPAAGGSATSAFLAAPQPAQSFRPPPVNTWPLSRQYQEGAFHILRDIANDPRVQYLDTDMGLLVWRYLDIATMFGSGEYLTGPQLAVLEEVLNRFMRALSEWARGLRETGQGMPTDRRNILLFMMRKCGYLFGWGHPGYQAALQMVPWFGQWLFTDPPGYP